MWWGPYGRRHRRPPTVRISHEGDFVRVEVRADLPGAGLFPLHAAGEAVALREGIGGGEGAAPRNHPGADDPRGDHPAGDGPGGKDARAGGDASAGPLWSEKLGPDPDPVAPLAAVRVGGEA